MVPRRYRQLYDDLRARLRRYEESRPLPGLYVSGRRSALLGQMVDSVRRTEYPALLTYRGVSPLCADPTSELFHPLKAAVHLKAEGEVDEAFWMLFLYVHFGRHRRAGWRYARGVVGGLSSGVHWRWANVSADPQQFRHWLHGHQQELRSGPRGGGFGNHRKYESLDAYKNSGTGAVVESYVNWIDPPRTHEQFMAEVTGAAQDSPCQSFRLLYKSMKMHVVRFGRLACIDYLATAGKLQLAPLEPDSAYLSDASSGPLRGARLLFGSGGSAYDLDQWVLEMDRELNVGPRVLEDALCNWQKSPNSFKRFSG